MIYSFFQFITLTIFSLMLDDVLRFFGFMAILKLVFPIRFIESWKAVNEWKSNTKWYKERGNKDGNNKFNLDLCLMSYLTPPIMTPLLYFLLFFTILKRPGTGGLGCLPARDV